MTVMYSVCNTRLTAWTLLLISLMFTVCQFLRRRTTLRRKLHLKGCDGQLLIIRWEE